MKPRLRPWLAIVLLGVFVYITAGLAPYFIANLRLQRYVEEITQSAPAAAQTPERIRAQVVERARQLGLPVAANDVHVETLPTSARITIRYLVRVDLPGYTVKLHFAPSAGR